MFHLVREARQATHKGLARHDASVLLQINVALEYCLSYVPLGGREGAERYQEGNPPAPNTRPLLCSTFFLEGSPHWAPKAPKRKLRKTSNYIILDPRPLKITLYIIQFLATLFFFYIYI